MVQGGRVHYVTGSAGAGPAWPRSSSGACRSRRGSHPLSPPEFPRAPSAGESGARTPRNHRLSAPRGGPTGRFSPEASPTGRYPRWLCYRSGEPPSTHIAHPSAHMGYSLAPERSLPRCRAGPGRMRQGSSGAGVVLAAIVGTPADRRAPREGGDVRNGTVSGLRRLPRRGAEALRRSTSPPQGFLLPFSYTHRPGRSGAHGPAGSGVDFSIPQNSFVWVLLKMGPLARSHAQRCNGPTE